MKIYIVRHAESKRNARQKSDIDAELTAVGEEQARRLGSYFHDINPNIVYCSTMKRAKTTLEKIRPFLKGIPIKYTSKIVEHNLGIYGKNGEDDWKSYVKDAGKQGVPFEKFKPEGGESLEEVYERAGKFYNYLLKEHKGKDILLVGHGIFSLELILYALGLPISEGVYYRLSNASVSTLVLNEKGKVKDFHINDYNQLIKEALKIRGEIGK
ncbi:MAG: histidine phosphatase family protein [Candidatus Pacearchaeota archaeon]